MSSGQILVISIQEIKKSQAHPLIAVTVAMFCFYSGYLVNPKPRTKDKFNIHHISYIWISLKQENDKAILSVLPFAPARSKNSKDE
jgi:hypothetical protein